MSQQPRSTDQPARVVMHEGSVSLPPGFEDRSANLFVPRDPRSQPNLSVARDWLGADETLPAYVERQLAMLGARLPGHRLVARCDERLGQHAPPLVGERIDAQYRSGAQPVRQRQAVFEVGAGRLLVFSASTPGAFDEAFDALWRAWLDSFEPASQA